MPTLIEITSTLITIITIALLIGQRSISKKSRHLTIAQPKISQGKDNDNDIANDVDLNNNNPPGVINPPNILSLKWSLVTNYEKAELLTIPQY